MKFNKENVNAVVAMSVYKNDNVVYLKKSVESIINQVGVNASIFIVIDGPVPEDIKCYLDEVSSHICCLLVNDVNKGLAFSMNRIIDYIIENDFRNVKYFFRMDADDISFHQRFMKQISYLSENELHVVGAECVEINDVDNEIGYRKVPSSHDAILNLMPRRCAINHPTVLIDFDLFRAGFRYNHKLMNTQDYYLWADLLSNGYKFGNISEPLLFFRRSNDFLSRRGRSKAFNDLKARFHMMRKLNKISVYNVVYALAFSSARMLPKPLLKVIYKFK